MNVLLRVVSRMVKEVSLSEILLSLREVKLGTIFYLITNTQTSTNPEKSSEFHGTV